MVAGELKAQAHLRGPRRAPALPPRSGTLATECPLKLPKMTEVDMVATSTRGSQVHRVDALAQVFGKWAVQGLHGALDESQCQKNPRACQN